MTLLNHFKKQIGHFVKEPSSTSLEPSPEKQKLSSSISMHALYKSSESKKSGPVENSLQGAYSHGLEEIYALETIDLKTVRRLDRADESVSSSAEFFSLKIKEVADYNHQLEFDFGDQYRGWMESFILMEPIHVLGLSQHSQKCLVDHGKVTLQDVIGINFRDFIYLKGMGQGHIDEVQLKLKLYLEGRALHRCIAVDFGALIRGIVGTFDRKKVYVTLEPFHLQELCCLSASDYREVRRAEIEEINLWRQQTHAYLLTDSKRAVLIAKFGRIIDVFIKPWIRQRLGLATIDEIEERISRVSSHDELALAVIRFTRTLLSLLEFPFTDFLIAVDEGVYAADQFSVEAYQRIIQKALSYFYHEKIVYPLKTLIHLLEREFAKRWETFPEGFIEKSLRLSPCLRVRREFGCFLVQLL